MTQSRWTRAAALLSTLAVVAGTLGAQSPDLSTFDAVSIKRHVGGGPSRSDATPNGHVAVNVPMFFLISQAYPVRRSDEIIDAPDWLYDAPYDVTARFAGTPTADQRQSAWRRLFADRFKLKAHLEIREKDTFALVLARAGRVSPNLKKSDVDCAATAAVTECTSGLTRGILATQGMSMSEFARLIQPMTGRTVSDQTGLTGLYAFSLKFSPTRPGVALDPNSRTELPDIFAALEDQLGLKLERARGSVDVLVIEHIELPTEN
jgi:uncharacterized protein (TIGR03435 family)